ncbi:thiamine-phosphate kinase [Gordonia mangrovi]|uniref:thiamine-phosphate kinase n=1 Tax=Gordonia mangrovi TaxID=2665643 RepID=UPI0021AD3F80|nr:thiamine-phosphate kinase [Gordonia mangrovi]MDY6809126.1 thiamine-phosphate kinase [Actinomycetota bacterium]UVF78506.1 thiamine-phosphate kinase [Gordonia mangrovi]
MSVGDARDPVDRSRTVGEVGERRLIAELTRSSRALDVTHRPPDVVIGSGDDAAVIDSGGPTVISTDTAVAGRHFRFDWSDPRTVGARAVVQSAADIAAMGGRVTGTVVSIACPPDTTVGTVLDMNAGILDATHRLGGRVLGGDLVGADEVVLTVTTVGALDGATPIVVGGARPGDLLAVTGSALGASAAGLALLLDAQRRGTDELLTEFSGLVAAHRLPAPDLTQGPAAARAGAHAMTDISDGLVEELITMAAASGVQLSVAGDRIPVSDDMRSAAERLGVDLRDWTVTGGEDHELLGSFAAGSVPPGWTTIGEVHDGTAVWVDGRTVQDLQGWQSFGS